MTLHDDITMKPCGEAAAAAWSEEPFIMRVHRVRRIIIIITTNTTAEHNLTIIPILATLIVSHHRLSDRPPLLTSQTTLT